MGVESSSWWVLSLSLDALFLINSYNFFYKEVSLKLHDYQSASENALVAKEGLLIYSQKMGSSVTLLMRSLDQLLGSAYSEMGRKYWLDAERIFSSLIGDGQSDLKALLGLSAIYLTQKRFNEASKLIERIIILSPARFRSSPTPSFMPILF